MSILPASGAGDESTGFYSVEIDQSLRLDGTSAHLSKTYSTTASSTTDFVMSLWLKPILKDTGDKMIASSYDGATVMMYWQFQSTRTLRIYIDPSSAGSNEFHVTTDMHFRDCSNWYNICLVLDMSQSSNVDKAKIYVNGTQASTTQTYSTGTPTTQNLVKSGTTFNISKYFTSAQYMDAYIADVHIIDGSANYTDFGETKNGVWIPKKYTGSYGNNGARLTFQDSSNIGYDYQTADRSTTNDFTANNLASTDVMPDSPTNNFCTLNSLSAGDETDMTEGNLTYADSRSGGTGQAKGTFPLSSGKWYWEVHYDYDPGASNMIGIVAVDEITNSHLAQDPNSGFGTYFAWDERGIYYQATDGTHSYPSGKTSYAAGDVLSFAMDVDAGKLFIRKNDGSFEDSGDPVAGTDPSFTFAANKVMTPLVTNYRGSVHVFNFGQNPSFNGDGSITAGTETDSGGVGLFKYAPPSGYLAICAKNLDDVTIGPSQSSQADDFFNTVLYSGNSSNTHQITGVGFQPDWLWIKVRNQSGSHYLADSSRGLGTGDSMKVLMTNGTTLEYTAENDQVRSFDADGFTLDDNTDNTWYVNRSSDTYVAWNWKLNGGTTSSNSDGDITSTVQVNQTAGFSIVTYTGTGTQSDTVGHGLGKKPAWYFTKSRSEAQNWHVYHHKSDTSAPENYIITLNATNARSSSSANFWNSTAPTTTVVSVGDDNSSNKTGTTYIMYCFAEIEGYSKFDKYVGNSTSDGTYVYTGFRPAWVMIKNITVGGAWCIFDNKQNTHNALNLMLLADQNLANSGGGTSDNLDFLSNGFKLRDNSSGRNASGSTYIYMAFAKQPFKFTNAR